MRITVEFYGRARRLTKTDKTEIELRESNATLKGASRAITEKFPELLNDILSSQSFEPIETFRFNINGKFAAQNLDVALKEGDKILLIPIAAGG